MRNSIKSMEEVQIDHICLSFMLINIFKEDKKLLIQIVM